MTQMKLRFVFASLILAAVVSFGALACGSVDVEVTKEESGAAGSGGTSPEAAATSPPAPPTATPVIIEEGEADEETGMRVEEVTIDGQGLGGKAKILVTNELDEECTGPVISVDLLDADGKVVGEMGIEAPGPLPAGEQKTYEQRYVGSKVAQARVSAITCENSAARHGAPQSPSKKDLEEEGGEEK